MKYILKILKMKIKIKIYLSAFIMSIIFTSYVSGDNAEVVMDAGFFKELSSKQVIQRDEIFDSLNGKIIIGRGKIISIAPNERYKKKYRVIIESSDSAEYDQKFLFYVFLENQNTVELLSADSGFEFKGQFMGYTPLGTRRNEYIIDVVMMDGSTVIE